MTMQLRVFIAMAYGVSYTPRDLALEMGVEREKVRIAMRDLVAKGLVRKTGDAPWSFRWALVGGARKPKDRRGKTKGRLGWPPTAVSMMNLKNSGRPRPQKATALEQCIGWGCEQ